MATINQHPSGVADWATICAWIHENRPDLWEGSAPPTRTAHTRELIQQMQARSPLDLRAGNTYPSKCHIHY
ncbi:hypothetical protein AB1285_26850 [Microbacterium sp. NRRL B-14842]|uniref:hypothetical protein n=1 Tax=Microbacterium sp. NRRL B-14842 TaxID=3162881 RepID=UPI003D2B392A